jgi:hypothetical protein
MTTTNTLAEALRWCARVLDAEHPAAIKARAALAAYEAKPAEPVMLVDGLTPHQFALRELHAFQQATGCDTAAEFAAAPAAPAQVPLTDEQIADIGHRKAWRYRHAAHHGATVYEFRLFTLIDFARAIEAHHGIEAANQEVKP